MYDILATTDNKSFVNKNFKHEYVTHFASEKTNKIVFTEDDLYNADTFSFGTQIGSITNKGSSAFSLLDLFEDGSKEYEATLNRLKTLPCIQNKEIDKTKNGKKTKGIPKSWVKYDKENAENNKILLDKHPYFFIYLYKDTRKKYKDYISSYNRECMRDPRIKMSLDDLLDKDVKTEYEEGLLSLFHRDCPVIKSNSVMNLVCKKIETLDKNIKQEVKVVEYSNFYENYIDRNVAWDWKTYKEVKKKFEGFKKDMDFIRSTNYSHTIGDIMSINEDDFTTLNTITDTLFDIMSNVCSNESEVTNYLIYAVYGDSNVESGKELLWKSYGKEIFNNIKNNLNIESFKMPIQNEDGDIIYLKNKYKMEDINIGR